MFEQLISLNPSHDTSIDMQGVIWSIEGDLYLAMQIDQEGHPVTQSEEVFKSLSCAKEWLHKQGIHTVFMRQSPAYNEMIGQSA